MKNIDEAYVIKNYTEGQSTISLAKELSTYPKKIERILKKNGLSLRSRSESQILAIQNGRAKHPTKGLKRTEEEKAKISMGVEKAWKDMPEEAKKQFCQSAKNRWDNMSPEKRREMQEKAGRALRLACLEGSKQEKFLKKKLEEAGHNVVMHKKGLIEGKFEIDLFLPLFGEDKLANTIKMDIIKNGLLISKGFCVIRVKYLCKNMNKSVERKLWDLVSAEVEAVKEKFPPKDKRFIKLEIK